MSKRLTVIIPCKNEREHIRSCVASAQAVADEVLVADSGSTDGTLEIARELGCRIIEREYGTSGDFKNWAIPQASCSWVFILDADERISSELAVEIRRELTQPQHDGYRVPRLNYFMGHPVHHTDWSRDRVVRLFRRDLGRYSGPSDHGDVQVAGDRVGNLKGSIYHYTISSWGQWLSKLARYSRVQAEQWYAAGRRPSWRGLLLNPPLRFLRDYVWHGGFLDGMVGLQVSWSSAFYSFMKQAALWELHNGRQARVVGELPSAARLPQRVSRQQKTTVSN
jgi:glycosyltransferase involved in cell wall biosynthesis